MMCYLEDDETDLHAGSTSVNGVKVLTVVSIVCLDLIDFPNVWSEESLKNCNHLLPTIKRAGSKIDPMIKPCLA